MDNSTTTRYYISLSTHLCSTISTEWCSPSIVVTTALWQIYSLLFTLIRSLQAKGSGCQTCDLSLCSIAEFQPRELRNWPPSFVPLCPLCAMTKERGRFCSSRGWNSKIECRSRVRGSVVVPFSHVAFLLSCVVSPAFEQLVPAHKLHIHYIHNYLYISIIKSTKRSQLHWQTH